jgi:hypothetical protein
MYLISARYVFIFNSKSSCYDLRNVRMINYYVFLINQTYICQLLEVRNCVMHSPDNRLSDDALDECFGRMVSILNAKKFSNVYSEKAIKELEKVCLSTLLLEIAVPLCRKKIIEIFFFELHKYIHCFKVE